MPYYDKDIVNALSFISASVKDVGFYINQCLSVWITPLSSQITVQAIIVVYVIPIKNKEYH